MLILKWGGELTPAGRIQAEELGRVFRCEYAGTQGLGLLRLHSTYRHDLKIYASDEGRVQMTAAAFAKGLLALEGELTPILVQMVKSANTNGLLDNDHDSSKYQNMVKARLHETMQRDREFTAEDHELLNPTDAISIRNALRFIKHPVKACEHVHGLVEKLMELIGRKREDGKTQDAVLYHGETWDLMQRRWGKLEKDFELKNDKFDISKVPDIYDCIKYDLQHNQHKLQFDQAVELYTYAKALADVVVPQEYGITKQEKLTIAQGICTPLLKKIRADLQRNIEEQEDDESVNRLNPRLQEIRSASPATGPLNGTIPQVLARGFVARQTRAHQAVLHEREPHPLASHRLAVRRPRGRKRGRAVAQGDAVRERGLRTELHHAAGHHALRRSD